MTKLSSIGQVAMVVKDVPRAVAFYRDTLGMKFLFQAPPALAFFDCGGIRLMLTVPEEKEFDHPGSILYFKVDDIDAVHADLKGKGVDFRRPASPHREVARPRAVDGVLQGR